MVKLKYIKNRNKKGQLKECLIGSQLDISYENAKNRLINFMESEK